MRHISFAEARNSVMTRAQLEDAGWRDSPLRRALASGELRRLQPNRYVLASTWHELWPESQHRIEVAAAVEEMRGGTTVASYVSAAVMYGWPLYRLRPSRVEMTAREGRRASNSPRSRRHEDFLPAGDVTEVGGVACTTAERTVFDLARTLGWEAAVAVADAALRSLAVKDRVYDLAVAAEWRERMNERASRSPGLRGVRQARRVIAFADGRAELPGESVSRIQLVRLGFTDLDLQVPVAAPTGHDYQVDIALRQARTFWEFDGKGKYLNESMRSGKSIEQVVLEEKRREDWIRGRTQWRMCRGEDAHVATPAAMAQRLAAFGIQPPR